MFHNKKIKLNIGCGLDYRDGFINIDGREDLPRIDKIINISKYSLLDYFAVGSMDYLPANDFIVKLPFRKRSVAEWVS